MLIHHLVLLRNETRVARHGLGIKEGESGQNRLILPVRRTHAWRENQWTILLSKLWSSPTKSI